MGAEKEQTLNPMTRDLAGTASQNIGRKLLKSGRIEAGIGLQVKVKPFMMRKNDLRSKDIN